MVDGEAKVSLASKRGDFTSFNTLISIILKGGIYKGLLAVVVLMLLLLLASVEEAHDNRNFN